VRTLIFASSLLLLAPPAMAAATRVGTLTEPAIPEASGLAPSRAHPGLYWVENDSGNPPDAFLIDPQGRRRMTLHVDGVPNIDWEDAASFDLRGRHYLLLADAGDNGAKRETVALHVVEEPARIADAHARPAWSIRFRWPGGPRDCEAVAVDARAGIVLLVSKRTVPAQLYSLPLRPRARGVLVAKFLGDVAGIPQPTRTERIETPFFGKYLAQVTAASLAPDRRNLAILTYRSIYLYRRRGAEGWAQAVSRPPLPLAFGWLPQAEALAFGLDGRALFVTGEHLPAAIVRVDVPPTP